MLPQQDTKKYQITTGYYTTDILLADQKVPKKWEVAGICSIRFSKPSRPTRIPFRTSFLSNQALNQVSLIFSFSFAL